MEFDRWVGKKELYMPIHANSRSLKNQKQKKKRENLTIIFVVHHRHHSDFENLTIAHIPDKIWAPRNETINMTFPNGTSALLPPPNVNPIQGQLWVPGVSSRTLLVVIDCVILYIYTCYLLWHEWVDNLALRRVYFWEAGHRRIKELREITAIQNVIPQDESQRNLPPYLPDPELRDTPPSSRLEREMVATTKFFDECVPAQPRLSSSVAAVTIIPDANRVAKAWMKRYKIETKLRRLRLIRSIIRHKMEMESDGTTDMYDSSAHIIKRSQKNAVNVPTTHHSVDVSATESGTVRQTSAAFSTTVPLAPNHGESESEYIPMLAPGIKASGETVLEEIRDFLYQDFDVKAEYSQSSSNPCLYGVSPKLLFFKSIEELQQMEEDLWVELREANGDLNDARLHAIEHNEGDRGLITTGLDNKCSDEDFEREDGIFIPNSTIQAFDRIEQGLRNRTLTTAERDQWEMAQEAANEMRSMPDAKGRRKQSSFLCRVMPCFGDQLKALPVVTFTSRQAAIAAGQSLADGGVVILTNINNNNSSDNNQHDNNGKSSIITSWILIWFAIGGGILLSVGNLSLQWATTVFGAPLTTVVAIQASLTVTVGTCINYLLQPEKTPKPQFLALGVVWFVAAVWMSTRAHVLYARDCHVEDQDQDDQSDSDDMDCIGSRDGYIMASSSSSPAAIELHQSKAQRSISYSSLEAIDNSSNTTFQSG
ncbi:ureide permease [Nitzschia inconspicua]|uniref:Ureide permease n=1 Tax=Nitzschia inconspicua TaxID=303405 RepID=A0A9K3KVA8_9STRA|nr:ureide permease [Nitzschia inconspicua]